MQRAAILIGVEKTGNLPRLQAVQAGVEYMQRWARSQPGMGQRVVTLTDAGGGRVRVQDIKDAIKRLVDLTTVEQLFLYFAGHGVNVRYNEYWLLCDAPDDPQAAVNVQGSATLARYCGIPHVVFISDACRTAAEGLQAQAIEGSSVFPNTGPTDQPGCVDLFYAARAGRPALEVKDPAMSAAGFQAVYTNTLVEGLDGARPELVQPEEERPGETVGRVHAWPLHRFLEAEVPSLLRRMGVGPGTSQVPDAVITSPPEAWLAQVALADKGCRLGPPSKGLGTPDGTAGQPETLGSVSQRALRAVLQGDPVPAEVLHTASGLPGGELFVEGLARSRSAPLPGHFESQCGFKVTGAAVAEVLSAGAQVELVSGPEGLVRVLQVTGPAASVLLVLGDGRGTLLPAIPGFIASLAYEDGELASVTYEPSDNSWRWQELQMHLPELRSLRQVVAAAARAGTFRLETKRDALILVERMRAAKGVDPTMAVYASYALHELHMEREIEDMQRYLRDDLRLSLFDVAMLAQRPSGNPKTACEMPVDVYPAVPLLSQGWSLLDVYGIRLPPALDRARRHLTESLWTLFDERGVAAVRTAIDAGEVR